MKSNKELGIWMDHSNADLIDLNSKKNNRTILSKFTAYTKEEALNKSESHMHNKRQQLQEAFYVEISNEILKYSDVLIFGPTNAKEELNNYLGKDSHFDNIKISIESKDKMTVNEKHALVKSFFKVI